MQHFTPCSTNLFFRSQKEGDQRLGELASHEVSSPTTQPRFVIAGYPDDEGIQLNSGRLGAKQAPDSIRKYFYKTTPSAWIPQDIDIHDIGNLSTEISLAERHETLKHTVAEQISAGHTWVGLGGGHDYGYPDGAGFLLSQAKSSKKPLVINFDAHLDVRPATQGLSSGTPFYRLLTDESLPSFDFVEIGIQGQCNSPAHYQWLQERDGLIIDLDEILTTNLMDAVLNRLAPMILSPRPTFISLDIDAFSSAYAPGCSQSWPAGLSANEFLPLMRVLKQRLDIKAFSIYEVSPPLDTDDQTSKLAAQILHNFIY